MRKWILMGVGCALAAAGGVRGETATGPARLAIPDGKALARAHELVHSVHKDEFAKGTREAEDALAKQLLSEAEGTKDDDAARYELFLEADEVAGLCCDVDTALKAAEELAAAYAVDGADLRRQTLERAGAGAKSAADFQAVGNAAMELAERAARDDDTAAALRFAEIGQTALDRSDNVAFAAALQVRIAEVKALAEEFTLVQKALKQLDANPKDAEAHLAVGKYYAMHKGQFAIGLPHLALSSDAALKELAFTDMGDPVDPLKQAALGDAWWDYGQKMDGVDRLYAQQRAREWYVQAKAGINGITLARIQGRLADGTAAATQKADAAGEGAVEILPLVDVSKDGAVGQWTVGNDGLTCAAGRYACLAIPYVVPEEYDLRVGFTRMEGTGSVAVLLAQGKKSFGFELDVKGEARFERVAGTVAKGNPTSVAATLSNDHPYVLEIRVRKDSFAAYLDGKLLTQYKTDYKDVSRYALWKLPDEKLCGVGANNAKVVFGRVQVVAVTGVGKPTR